MRTVLLLLLAVVAICASNKWRELDPSNQYTYTFEDFKIEFNRQYKDDAEEAARRELFQQHFSKILQHNSDKTKTWVKGVNKFADRSEAEFRNYLGVNTGLLARQRSSIKRVSYPHLPEFNTSLWADANVDWRTKGVITVPKDQGACGSCWSFATAETIESYNALKTRNLLVLSEQQILDCTPNPNDCGGNGGCGGGTVELAVDRIGVMGGLSTEAQYPYISGGGTNYKCDMTKVKPVVKVSNYVALPSNQMAPVINHLNTVGPLAISVDASTWSDYGGGVFAGCDNANPDIDHAVQLVGYGTDTTHGDYWLVRNSWGADYGEGGYIRLKRFATPPCGVDSQPGDGDGCNGGPTKVTVCGNCGILYDTVYVTIQ